MKAWNNVFINAVRLYYVCMYGYMHIQYTAFIRNVSVYIHLYMYIVSSVCCLLLIPLRLLSIVSSKDFATHVYLLCNAVYSRYNTEWMCHSLKYIEEIDCSTRYMCTFEIGHKSCHISWFLAFSFVCLFARSLSRLLIHIYVLYFNWIYWMRTHVAHSIPMKKNSPIFSLLPIEAIVGLVIRVCFTFHSFYSFSRSFGCLTCRCDWDCKYAAICDLMNFWNLASMAVAIIIIYFDNVIRVFRW